MNVFEEEQRAKACDKIKGTRGGVLRASRLAKFYYVVSFF
jgi:hypothetical protein